MKIKVTQVTFLADHVLIGGEPVGDPTKIVIAAVDPIGAVPVALAVATGIAFEVEPPDDAIVEVLEKPKG